MKTGSRRCTWGLVSSMGQWLLVNSTAPCVILSGYGAERRRESIEQPMLTADEADKKVDLHPEIALKQRTRAKAYIQIVGGDIGPLPTPAEAQPSGSLRGGAPCRN